ncbi:hypothetical protein H4R99_008470, partial [Coemansia sp. RSA 1722]
ARCQHRCQDHFQRRCHFQDYQGTPILDRQGIQNLILGSLIQNPGTQRPIPGNPTQDHQGILRPIQENRHPILGNPRPRDHHEEVHRVEAARHAEEEQEATV